MNWNARLKKAREEAGITKSELARLVSVSPPTVTDWESGAIKKIDGENLLRAADAVGVTPFWLMFGETWKPANPQG